MNPTHTSWLLRIAPGISLVALLLLSAPPARADRDFREEFEVGNATSLNVRLETGGSIRVEQAKGATITVEARFTGKDQDNVEFSAKRIGTTIEVWSGFRENRRQNRSGGEVTIRLPGRFDVDLETRGGEVAVHGIEGQIEIDTLGGEISLENVSGEIDAKTMGGDVRLSDSEADGKLVTMGGNITLRNVCGAVGAETMGGNVIYDNVDEACAGSCREVRISTMGGNVEAPDAPCGADLETMGGNIRIDKAGEHVKATTMGGSIVIGAVDGWVRATTMGGTIEVTMVGDPTAGRRDVRLESKGGDVVLTLPDGISAEFEVTLAYTQRARRTYEIKSDFELQQRRSDDWSRSGGTPRKYIYGRGEVGAGQHKIRIETVDGDVRIIRR